jgi:hypothetical protein
MVQKPWYVKKPDDIPSYVKKAPRSDLIPIKNQKLGTGSYLKNVELIRPKKEKTPIAEPLRPSNKPVIFTVSPSHQITYYTGCHRTGSPMFLIFLSPISIAPSPPAIATKHDRSAGKFNGRGHGDSCCEVEICMLVREFHGSRGEAAAILQIL